MGHSKSHYIKIWAILCALLVISVIGPMAGILILTLITAFGIACVKAYLVIVHFMHLPLDKKFCTYLLTTCLAFMLLLFAFVAPDVMNHEGRNWVNHSAKKETRCTELAHAGKIDKAECKAMPMEKVNALAKADKPAKPGAKPAPKGHTQKSNETKDK